MRLSCAVEPLALPTEPSAEPLLFRPSQASGSTSTCVVMCHGGGNDRLYGFWYAIEALTSRGKAVLTAHLPGHGAGGTDCFTVSSVRARLDALVQLARDRTPARHIVLLGQSMGGAFALDLALRSGPIGGLILVSPPLSLALGPRVLSELGALTNPEITRALRYVSLWEALPALGPFKRDRFPTRVETGTSYLEAFRAALVELDLESRGRKAGPLPRPVLIVHGRQDGIIPVEHARRLKRALGGTAELFELERGHHLDVLLHRRVLEGMLDWMERSGL